MRLIALRLQNFRQHEDTQILFESGLTGIIGPNGAGKSTLLEAIAWALYGNPAARGKRDSIRFSRAAPRALVRVELEFALAGHRYFVRRELDKAECFLDGADTPIANSITSVTELLQRRLGMTRAEFFHTYFTGQKELDVMATLSAQERARFLSRVLGYDRLTGAQDLVRERRRALTSEISGLKQGMPDAESIARAVSETAAPQPRAIAVPTPAPSPQPKLARAVSAGAKRADPITTDACLNELGRADFLRRIIDSDPFDPGRTAEPLGAGVRLRTVMIDEDTAEAAN